MMEKLECGMILVHKGSEQVGRITKVGQGGKLGEFRAKSGARFTVEAGEMREEVWEPDVLDELERLLMVEPKVDVKLVWRTAA